MAMMNRRDMLAVGLASAKIGFFYRFAASFGDGMLQKSLAVGALSGACIVVGQMAAEMIMPRAGNK